MRNAVYNFADAMCDFYAEDKDRLSMCYELLDQIFETSDDLFPRLLGDLYDTALALDVITSKLLPARSQLSKQQVISRRC